MLKQLIIFWLWVEFYNIIFTISNLQYHFSNIIFKINELELFWVLNFTALGICFVFGTKFSWNEGIGTCLDVECMLLGRNFDYFVGYLVVTAPYLVFTARYCSFPLLVWMLHCSCLARRVKTYIFCLKKAVSLGGFFWMNYIKSCIRL